jgi:hypothetical protein
MTLKRSVLVLGCQVALVGLLSLFFGLLWMDM